jgi:hypothetical protein
LGSYGIDRLPEAVTAVHGKKLLSYSIKGSVFSAAKGESEGPTPMNESTHALTSPTSTSPHKSALLPGARATTKTGCSSFCKSGLPMMIPAS